MSPSQTHEACIHQFYTAFAEHDAAKMAACYHADVRFEDPAFGPLSSQQVRTMWQMLLERSKGNLKISHSQVQADEESGQASWEAWYPFSATGRQVHNQISAKFRFKDGLIIDHQDQFDLWRWSRQALGLPGLLLGWSPLLKSKIRKQALSGLAKYQGKQGNDHE